MRLYKHADTNSIPKPLNQVNWNQLLQNKNANEKVAILNNIILNIFSNFPSQKKKQCLTNINQCLTDISQF